tara:strand:- start:20583 stop:21416 length:834 start_codon:yes stop_codon:yes gene_type:complete
MTDRLAVFGNPINHSLSPKIHQMFADAAGIDMSYERVLVPLGQFSETAGRFFDEGGMGINITVPFKGDAFEYVDTLSEGAVQAGAVNTIVRQPSGELKGFNTDGAGLTRDLQSNLGWRIKGQTILILGAGGAVQGVLASLLAAEPHSIVIANRTASKAQALATKLKDKRVSASPLTELSGSFDLIVSGSSAGLSNASEAIALSKTLMNQDTCCYDMIYGKRTEFLKWCEDLPANQRADGLGMLVEQAARAFELWYEVNVDGQSVLNRMRRQQQTNSN